MRRRQVSDSAILKHRTSDWVCEWDIPKYGFVFFPYTFLQLGPDPSGRTIHGTADGCQSLSCARSCRFLGGGRHRSSRFPMIVRPSYVHGMEASRAFGYHRDHRDQAEPHRQYYDVLCSDHPLELPWEWLTRHGVESWCLRLNLKRQEEPHGDDAAFRVMMV